MDKISKPKKGYWYHFTIETCVLCGRECVTKERRYTEKPKDYNDRYKYIEYACGGHFV